MTALICTLNPRIVLAARIQFRCISTMYNTNFIFSSHTYETYGFKVFAALTFDSISDAQHTRILYYVAGIWHRLLELVGMFAPILLCLLLRFGLGLDCFLATICFMAFSNVCTSYRYNNIANATGNFHCTLCSLTMSTWPQTNAPESIVSRIGMLDSVFYSMHLSQSACRPGKSPR